MKVVDAHLHLWDPDVLTYTWLEGALNRRFGPSDLATALQNAPAAEFGFVFVQSECASGQSIAEVDWVTSLASDVPLRGIVARAPMEDPAATDLLLAALAGRPLVVGVRRLLQSEPPGFSEARGFRAAARMVADARLTFDACVRWPQLPLVTALADDVPDLTIVLDHIGKPPGRVERSAGSDHAIWAAELRRLSRRENVMCKISGLPAELGAQWTTLQAWRYLDIALEAFGPQRMMFGGDWPVSTPLSQWIWTVTAWLDDRLGRVDRQAILAGTAERIYRLA